MATAPSQGVFSMASHRNEDTLYYHLYFSQQHNDLLGSIAAHVDPFTRDYLWQKDPFELTMAAAPDGPSAGAHLMGSTTYGDNLEDEWFIVFLLFHLTTKFPDLLVQVYDTDGEFLLIEAALELPTWLNPETSQNRTFVHQGKLHIVPLPQSPADILAFPGGDLSLRQGIDIVRGPHPTEASPAVQAAIMARIQGYPLKARESFHRAKCLVPKKIAHLLNNCPQLVAPAVEAFYLRDPVGLRACSKMEIFPPEESILTTVKFTKCLFAQLASQDFYPPKPFKLPPKNSSQFKAADLGMKLACGFEIVMTDKFYQVPDIDDPDDIESYPFNKSSLWGTYFEQLVQRGYFKGEKEGSALYRQLESEAKRNFIALELESRKHKSLVYSDPRGKIKEILETIPINEETLASNEPVDSEKWLELTPEEFEKLLQEQQKKMEAEEQEQEPEDDPFGEPDGVDDSEDSGDDDGDGDEGGEVDEEGLKTMANMIHGIKAFMENVSGLEGAEVPGEHQPLDFDPEEFVNTLKRTVGALEELEVNSKRGSQSKAQAPKNVPKESKSLGPSIEEIMEAMDAELATTTKLADDFEKLPLGSSPAAKNGKTPNRRPAGDGAEGKEDEEQDEEQDEEDAEKSRPVDLNLNLVKNLLESFSSQQGLSGPASNLLSSLGLGLGTTPEPPK